MKLLSAGLSFGMVDGRAVFIDTLRDRYFLLDYEDEQAFLRTRVGDLLDVPPTITHLFQVPDLVPSSEFFTPRPHGVEVLKPQADAIDWAIGQSTLRSRAGALSRRSMTERSLRRHGLHRVLTGLNRRKCALGDRNLRVAEGRPIASAFLDARIWRHARDRCLSESLALFGTLLDAGCAATLVIGVTLRPFAAHCWVQQADRVLNDHRDHARGYTAVLTL